MEIRNAALSDLDALAQLEAACFPPAEAADRDTLLGRIRSYGSHFWLLYEGDTLLSFVDGFVTDAGDLTDEMYENPDLHNEDGAWQMIFGVNTHPDYRRRGYAGVLLRQAISDAKAQGRRGLVLTCKDALVPYYGSFGFQNEGFTEKSTHGGVTWNQMRLTF